ncbi:MAG TPA: carbon-nitrogen hydrolase family protein [Blastocatellia bacterium]|nr:carbon-nitrogen hydrolase family protein [Blastocatellia bacterium]HMV82936.1 carbon-nitrogen hydrolase family protein [Blastocatellia bacterium]HMX27256.1 carbon-nitrogen hydrolase family protein [Blastocatellia bacterium]HMY72963.1 carbon-nitrogen hydrolase family protein [Blastocatellia bacterium]HMZ22436.1 carbon-nitrogen hydrolase family protein [Blastocatellia bacterium]
MPPSIVVVAAVQAAPIYLNLERSLTRALELIAEAAKRRAQLVVFPESWLPGYPAWLDTCRDVALWDHLPTKRLYAQLLENSVTIPSRTTEALAEAAKRHNLTLVMGVHERVNQGAGRGTLYNSILTFGPTGELLNVHRKLVPTFNERLIWGQGDGRGLRTVETPVGNVGGLICWEHWMPHARQALHIAGEDIHVALWPSVKEMHQIASRHYAFEGRCFVVAAGGIMRRSDLPGDFEFGENTPGDDSEFILNGGSAVIGPDGQYVAGPAFGSEVIILARINLERIREESLTLDVTGHFNRPDLFDFRFKGLASAPETESAELIPAPGSEDLLHSGTEVLLTSATEVLSGTDSAPALRVVKPSRPVGYDAGYNSDGLGLEKQRSQSS